MGIVVFLWSPWRTAPPSSPVRLSAQLGVDGGLASGVIGSGAAAVLSPDDATLVFVAQRTPGSGLSIVWVATWVSSRPRRLPEPITR